ncbi:unnamed protein product [Diatraea saccharalis]|uniref:Lysosomal Pro-X carboxypeptidase n=1 Tax=Diatraea saccharalis TaxID=40085 RepID=A0A9N9RI71_9NEOP|nr:unnamed protein product [Diatraea saccharalis]
MWDKLCIFIITTALVKSEYKYETKYFKVPLDHFGFQRKETFQIKYLVNDDFWDRGSGPIFFYTGNEGQIELFAQHTGFMWEAAEEFNAKLVFAEHRYYGTSMPFGNASLDNNNIGYLTSSQALADYADLVDFLQDHAVTPKYPVIAFGGSYGGMLAAYFRQKYPHLVAGAIAASAPIHMFPGMTPCDAYYRIVTSAFKIDGSQQCMSNIQNSWSTIRNFASNATNAEWLHKNWNLCDPLKNSSDVQQLLDFLQSAYQTLAMVNYPFPSDFLVPLPAYPVRVVCQYLNEKLYGNKLLEGIGKLLDTFTNYDKKSKCVDYKKGSDYGNLDASGWDYQSCTEMVMPMCTTGKHDMFEPQEWNFTKYSEDCYKRYNVYPLQDAARVTYGGDRLQAASNIVYSNGLKDPWAGGGVFNTVNESIETVLIIDGAHHLDLMPSNPADPSSVKIAREFHKTHIRRWIQKFRK